MHRSRTRKVAILASGQMATALASLFLAAVLSRVFDKADYATYCQTLLAYNLVVPILTLGLPVALYHFMPGSENRARAILFENLILLGAAGLVFSVFLVAGGNRLLAGYFNNPELERILRFFALYPIMAVPASATAACLMARDKVTWLAVYTLGTRVTMLLIVLGAIWLVSPTPEVAIKAAVAAACVTFGWGLASMIVSVRGSAGSIGVAGMKAQLAFSIPMGLGMMITTIHRSLDKMIVSTFTEPENFAVYVNGAMEIPFIGIITGSATAVLLPEMRKLIKEGSKAEALKIWKRAGIKAGVIIIPLMGFCMAAAPDLMAILYSERYRESHYVFRIYLMLLPIRIAIFGAVFQAAGRTDLIFKRSVIALVANLLLSISFAMLFGYKFIAVATVVAIYLAVIPYSMWKVSQIFGVGVGQIFPWRPVFKLLAVTALGCGMATLTVLWFPWDLSLVRTAAVGGAYALVMVAVLPLVGIFYIDFSRGVALRNRLIWTLGE